jgi:hypothetical protein
MVNQMRIKSKELIKYKSDWVIMHRVLSDIRAYYRRPIGKLADMEELLRDILKRVKYGLSKTEIK